MLEFKQSKPRFIIINQVQTQLQMSWFFKNQNNTQNDSKEDTYHPKFVFSTTKTTCQNDPEDNQFQICKSVIEDNNGTRETSQRTPSNDVPNSASIPNDYFSSQLKKYPQDNQKACAKADLSSKLSKLQFTNTTTINLPFVAAIQKKTTCKTDPQDDKFLLCNSTLTDDTGTREMNSKKVLKKSINNQSSIEFKIMRQNIKKSMEQIMQQVSWGKRLMMKPLTYWILRCIDQQQNRLKTIETNHAEQVHPLPQNSHDEDQRVSENCEYLSKSERKKDSKIYQL